MKNNGVCVFLLIVQLLWLETSQSAQSSDPELKEELSKQEKIYRSEGARTPGGYTINRSLVDYIETLPPEFDRTLAELGPKERWLDIGAGKGQAILDYYDPGYDLTHVEGRDRRGTKAQTVAVSIEDRRAPDWQQKASSLAPNQMQYFFSKPLREYSLEELGQFRVITDVIGGFSYTDNLSRFMEKLLSFLQVNGGFFTVLQDVRSEGGKNQPHYSGSPYLTEIVKADGSDEKVCSWLKSIACVKVSCEFKGGWTPPIEVYHVHKVCNEITVPSLSLVRYEAGTPPERRFQLRK